MSQVTTHVLDTALGRPAAHVAVTLHNADGVVLGTASTDSDGRTSNLGADVLAVGRYRLVFDTAAYFAASGTDAFYPSVTIDFDLTDASSHYHLPLLLAPFAYSTYRGS